MTQLNKTIHGLNILDEEIHMSQFAYDITFFLDGRKESFCSCLQTLQQFPLKSGLKMNCDEKNCRIDRVTMKCECDIYAGIEFKLESCNIQSLGCCVFD